VPERLRESVSKAERILVGIPETTVNLEAGKPFLIEVDRALRGTGARGSRARILTSPDSRGKTELAEKTLYAFLLVKGPGGKGWATLDGGQLVIEKGRARWLEPGREPFEFSTRELEELIDAGGADAGFPTATRPTLEGRWLLHFAERGGEIPGWLLELAPSEDRLTAKLLDSTLDNNALKSANYADSRLTLVFEVPGAEFQFSGTWNDGRLRGVLTSTMGAVAPGWLVPTEAQSLATMREAKPAAGNDELKEALESDQPLAELLRFVRRKGQLPLALDAYQSLIPLATTGMESAERLQTVIEAYEATAAGWGEPLRQRAQVEALLNLARSGKFPELGLELAGRTIPQMTAESPAGWRLVASRSKGQLLLQAGRTDEALACLREVHDEFPLDAEATWALAQHAQQQGRLEDSLELLGELTVLPGLEAGLLALTARRELSAGGKPPPQLVPSKLVEKTWKVLQRDPAELSNWLDELFLKKMRALGGEPQSRTGNGNRVVLAELFTGAQCAPCVAADLSLGAIEGVFDRSQLIVLRYHQHTPGSDPLASPDTLQRFEQYGGSGTPSVYLNGRPVEGVGGSILLAPAVIPRLKTQIAAQLSATTPYSLKLAARVRDPRGLIDLEAEGLGAERFPPEVRLHLALAEQRIPMLAKNGIRVHEMVVRLCPGEIAGLKPEAGRLKYTGGVNLADQRERVASYLEFIEKESSEKFDKKPIDLTRLIFVGWLQRSDTGEILQAASIPLEGELNGPETNGPRKSEPKR
jgi:tetratricopeptide (TPR) repeat protein